MITTNGGYVKIVNQETILTGDKIELRVYAKMFYANNTAKQSLSKQLHELEFFLSSKERYNDHYDVKIKKIIIEPLLQKPEPEEASEETQQFPTDY